MLKAKSFFDKRIICEAYPLGQTFVGNKKNKIWIWTVVNHWQPGILKWKIGDRLRWCAERNRSSETFKYLWSLIKCWHSFWYVRRTRMRSSRR